MKMINRRSFLAAAGLSAAAMALTACGSSSSTASSAAPAASDAASEAAGSEASTQAIQSLEDLDGKSVGVQLGTTGDLMMTEEIENAEGLNLASVERYNKAADAVQALLTNKIDAVCIDDQVAKNFIAANPDTLTMLDTAYSRHRRAEGGRHPGRHPEQVHRQGGGRRRLRQPRGCGPLQRHPGHGHQRRVRPL